jgi:hypothetical protein
MISSSPTLQTAYFMSQTSSNSLFPYLANCVLHKFLEFVELELAIPILIENRDEVLHVLLGRLRSKVNGGRS